MIKSKIVLKGKVLSVDLRSKKITFLQEDFVVGTPRVFEERKF